MSLRAPSIKRGPGYHPSARKDARVSRIYARTSQFLAAVRSNIVFLEGAVACWKSGTRVRQQRSRVKEMWKLNGSEEVNDRLLLLYYLKSHQLPGILVATFWLNQGTCLFFFLLQSLVP